MSSPGSPALTNFSNISFAHESAVDEPKETESGFSNDRMDVDMTSQESISLTSFVPIIQKLPGIFLEDNMYHVDTLPLSADLQEVISYCKRIEGLTLTDVLENEYPRVSTATLIRLGIMKAAEWLSSLKYLRIDNADSALDYLWFCTTPSLETLEVAQVLATQHLPLSSFFKELVWKASRLTSVTLGPGRLPFSAIQTTLQFTHLRQLHIGDAVDSLNFEILEGVSALPELGQLTLDTRTAVYAPFRPSNDNPEDKPQRTYPVSTEPFPKLTGLNVVSNVVLMGDLVYRLFPRALEQVYLTLVQNGPLDFPKDWSDINPDILTQSGPVVVDAEVVPEILVSHTFIIRGKKSTTRTCRGYQGTPVYDYTCNKCWNIHMKRLESPKLATRHFSWIIEELIKRGKPRAFSVSRLDQTTLPDTSTFPQTTFTKLASFPHLENLHIKDWSVLSVNDIFLAISSSSGSPSSMRTLRLPINSALNSGIMVSTLPSIARYYPKLVTLQSIIIPSTEALVPNVVDNTALSHGLRELSVGGEFKSIEEKLKIAAYLSFLFPRLENISTQDGYDVEDWQLIHKLVKMCQEVRALEESIHRPA